MSTIEKEVLLYTKLKRIFIVLPSIKSLQFNKNLFSNTNLIFKDLFSLNKFYNNQK